MITALILICSVSQAETTLYLSDVSTQITLPDGYYALWTTMGENEKSLSEWGMTRRQAVAYLKERGSLMEAISESNSVEYSLAVMDNDGTDLAKLTQRELQTLVSGISDSYAQSGGTLENPGLYQTEHATLLRYTVRNSTENWWMTEYIFTEGNQVLSLQALVSGRKLTTAEQQASDRVAMSVWPNAKKPAKTSGETASKGQARLTAKRFDDTGITLGVPEGYTALTRKEILADQSINSAVLDMVEAEERIAGVAVAADNNSEIWVLEGRAELYTVKPEDKSIREKILSAMGKNLAAGILDPEGTAASRQTLNSDTYETADTVWRLSYEHWDTGNYDEYALLYAGIRNGREIGILFVRYDGEVTRTDLDTMNQVAASIVFDAKTNRAKARSSAYTVTGTGLKVSLPQNWEKGNARDGLRFSSKDGGGVTIVITSADIVPSGSAVARSAYDTTYYSRRDIADLYDTSFDAVETVIAGEHIFYKVHTKAAVTAYDQKVEVSEVDYTTVVDGKMILLAYIGPEETDAIRDFETMVKNLSF